MEYPQNNKCVYRNFDQNYVEKFGQKMNLIVKMV